VLDMVSDGSFAGFVKGNAEMMRALGGNLWTNDFLRNFSHTIDPATGDVVLTPAGITQFETTLRHYLLGQYYSPTLRAKFDRFYTAVQGLYLRARGVTESPTLAMLQLDAVLRPDVLVRPPMARVVQNILFGRRVLTGVGDTPEARVGAAVARAQGQSAETVRIKSSRAEAATALNIKKGATEVNVVDVVADAIATVTTEQARRQTAGLRSAALARVTRRSVVPEERVPVIRKRVAEKLALAGIDPKKLAQQIDEAGGKPVISFTAAQTPAIITLVNEMKGTWFGDQLPSELTSSSFNGTSMSLEAYNRLQEVLTDTVVGPGSVRDRAAEAVPKSLGYALWTSARDFVRKIDPSDKYYQKMLDGFHVEFDGANHTDPGVREAVEFTKRLLDEIPKWVRQIGSDAFRNNPGALLSDIVVDIVGQLVPPLKTYALFDVVDPVTGVTTQYGMVGLHGMFVEGAGLPNAAGVFDRLTDIEDLFSAFKPGGIDVTNALEFKALVELRRIEADIASNAYTFDTMPDTQKAIFTDSVAVLAEGIRRRADAVRERANGIGIALAGGADAGFMNNFTRLENAAKFYKHFFDGEWELLFEMASNVGQTAALENFGDLQKKYSQSEAILAMVGRMRAHEVMSDLAERLAMYGVRGDMQALTGDIPLGQMQARGAYVDKVAFYINQILNGGDRVIKDSKGNVIRTPEPPVGGEDVGAYTKAHELIQQWGFKVGRGDWVVQTLADGTRMPIPTMVLDNLNDALQRTAPLQGAYGEVAAARRPWEENVFDVERTPQQAQKAADAVKARRRGAALGALAGGYVGAMTLGPIGATAGSALGVYIGADVKRALNTLFTGIDATLASSKVGLTTGLFLPNAAYYTGNAVGGFFQALMGVGAAQTFRMFTPTRAKFIMGVVSELFGSSYFRVKADPLVTVDGRIFTVRQAGRLAQAEGLSGSFIQAETVRAVADDLRRMEPGAWNKLTRGFYKWQDTLAEVASAIDNTFRVSVFVDEVNLGKSTAEAAETARKIAFDYTALTDFEKKVMRRVVLFYSFQRRSLDLFFDTLLTNPGRITAQLRTIKFANETLLGEDNEIVTPDYMETRLLLYARQAVRDSYESGQTVTMAPALPIGDIIGMVSDIANITTDEGQRGLVSKVSPVMQAPFVFATGADLFSGRDIGNYNKIPTYYYELDMNVSGGVAMRSLFGAQWRENKDGMANDTDDSRGYYHATNEKAWWLFRNILQIPGISGRSMSTLESFDRAEIGAVEAMVEASRAYREAGGIEEFDTFFINTGNALEYVMGQPIVPRPDDPDMIFFPAESQETMTPRTGLTVFDERLSALGVRAARIENPAVAKDRLYREAGFKLKDEMKQIERGEYPRPK
jgi:hypothetical protein